MSNESYEPKYDKHAFIRGNGKDVFIHDRYYVEDHQDGSYLLRPLFIPHNPTFDYALWDFKECEAVTELEWFRKPLIVRLNAEGRPEKEEDAHGGADT